MITFMDSFTEKTARVKYKGKYYHFEFLTACGWVSALPNGEGSPKHEHPKGAWDILSLRLGLKTDSEDAYITKEWVQENDKEYAHTWEWAEHPEEYNDWCWCETCRSYAD